MKQIITTPKDFQPFIDNMLGRDFAWDFETSGLDKIYSRPLGLALSYVDKDNEMQSAYVVFEHTVPATGKPDEGVEKNYISRTLATKILRPLFAQRDVMMVAHHVKFDQSFLRQLGLTADGVLYDTMIGAWYVNENRGTYGLKALAWEDLHVSMDKYHQLHVYKNYTKDEFLGVPLEEAATYAMADTENTLELMYYQYPLLEEEDLLDPFFEMSMPLSDVLSEMEDIGFATDRKKTQELLEEYEARAVDYEGIVWNSGIDMVAKLYEQGKLPDSYLEMVHHLEKAGEEVLKFANGYVIRDRFFPMIQKTKRSSPRVFWFNVGSNKQLYDLFYKHLGMKLPREIRFKKNASGDIGVDKQTLTIVRHFMGDKAYPELNALLEWRRGDKFMGTYLRPLLEKTDKNDSWAIRASFNQTVARTGRLSSSKPNLQNIPARGPIGERCRDLFVARPGYKLVVADFSGQEFRFAGHISQDEAIIKAFSNDMDLHALTGAGMMNKSYEDFMALLAAEDKEAKDIRRVAKTVNFASIYGSGPSTLQKTILVDAQQFITINEAADYIENFNETYRGFYDWKIKLSRYVTKYGYIRTFANRKRRIPEIWSLDKYDKMGAERQAVSSVIQGGCADITNLALIKIAPLIKQYGARIICVVHDEIIVESPEEHAEQVARIVEQTMRSIGSGVLRIPMAVEAGIGDTWYKAK